MTVVLVCGSRGWSDYQTVRDELARFVEARATILHGGAAGADACAARACGELGLNSYVFAPEYDKFGKDAPHVRNDEMLKNATEVLAFWDGVSPGTHSVIRKAQRQGLPVKAVALPSGEKQPQ